MSSGSTRRMHWGVVLMTVLVLALAAIAVSANVWKREFRLAHVRVQGNTIVTEGEILTLAGLPTKAKLFAIDLYAVRQRVQRNQFIKEVSVNREVPDGISIVVVERRPIAAIVLDRLQYLDADGFVLPAVQSDSVFDLPVITGNFPRAECIPGRTISTAGVREAVEVLSMARRIGEDLYQLISEIHIEQDSTLILYTTEGGVPVVFGRGDHALKLVTFDGFWKQIVMREGAGALQTVDLRFADQVVVRRSGDAASAQ